MRAMKRFLAHALSTCLGLAIATSAVAGGYMRSGGETFVGVGLKLDYNDSFFDKSGERQHGGCDSGWSMPLFVDHGLSYYTNVFASTSVRYKDCPGDKAWSLSDSEVGLRRRVDPLSNDWVWEASLFVPTSRLGAMRSSDAAAWGYNLGLHWRDRPDPYVLDDTRDPLAGHWDAGFGVRGWAKHLPLEGWAYVTYSRPLGLTNWALGHRAWTFSATLDWRQSLTRTHATAPAVDAHDQFHLLDLRVSFEYPLSRFERFGLSFSQSLLGENRDDSSGITVRYGKTFR